MKRAFHNRILPVDAMVALAWGDLQAGRNVPVIDSLIAATALVGRMVLVTRNKPDFSGLGVEILDPWL